MKTITKDHRSLYIFEDTETVTLTDDNIVVGSPVRFIIGDCNNSDTVLHEGVTPPADWTGHKYDFDGTTWTANPDWVDPATLEEEIE